MILTFIYCVIAVLAAIITIQGVMAYRREHEAGYLFIAGSVGVIPLLLSVLFYVTYRRTLQGPRTADWMTFEKNIKTGITAIEYLSLSFGLFLLLKRKKHNQNDAINAATTEEKGET